MVARNLQVKIILKYLCQISASNCFFFFFKYEAWFDLVHVYGHTWNDTYITYIKLQYTPPSSFTDALILMNQKIKYMSFFERVFIYMWLDWSLKIILITLDIWLKAAVLVHYRSRTSEITLLEVRTIFS